MDLQAALPPSVKWITETLEDAGFETWVVGGAIRNLILGRTVEDWDLATQAKPEEIIAAFPRTVPIGIEHGTVGVLARDGTLYDVTTFRRDVKSLGRQAVVEFSADIGEDLARRDFTFNALAWHPLRQDLLDPTGGIADIDAGVLRTVGDPEQRFSEDFLRVLRALRFSGQFGLSIERETWTGILGAVPGLALLSPERVQQEIMKVLAKASRPSIALSLYSESGALRTLYPELDQPAEVRVSGSEPDSFARVLEICDGLKPIRPLVRLAVLFSLVRLAEGIGQNVGWAVESLMRRLRFSNADTKRVSSVVTMYNMAPPATEPSELRQWLSRAGPDYYADVVRIWIAEARAVQGGSGSRTEKIVNRISMLRSILKTCPPLSVSDLELDGTRLKDLGLTPGPKFAEIFAFLLKKVLERPELNNQGDLEALLGSGGFLSTPSSSGHEAL